ncbi:MAG: YebC/PmpR family DNA-binding transcriptional regulator [Nitrospina sp.]|jgi:YebC/PmpR family DNA-binding regulatory protein|nr:YebC/PmpR family DNA-binding transcriptional regulator [Nitrospina sp.]MBT3874960.1 YebC/PmpR family DNA-binding transcriptional regulator [Nitrospina sp.]MBT4047187.1 YebC/PmpR family DNA-binding transcriptional regulator [Nitrospina sp.]MBT4557563.1 YebC/PmpR family DNA-binding transcriptional regulator [Nitrospina sp.]MBT5348480.1 YebC/PmpR family DNA-binding transcriptional regulator [Nitrospina sp.]
MSGHSKWASIKHKKGAADAKRGKIFTKLIKEITVAARIGGGDPDGNPRLRTSILIAKSKNMPVDNITRAIKKGTGELEGVHYDEVTYEGYGPGGAAIFLEAMTDNKNRTVSEIRAALGKAGGNLGETGCVGWMFEQKGFITINKAAKDEDELMELAIDAGADDMQTVEDHYEITTAMENFETVRKALEEAGLPMDTAEITRIPQNTVTIDEKKGKALLKLMDILDDHDDIQKAYSNFDIPDDVMAAILENS